MYFLLLHFGERQKTDVVRSILLEQRILGGVEEHSCGVGCVLDSCDISACEMWNALSTYSDLRSLDLCRVLVRKLGRLVPA